MLMDLDEATVPTLEQRVLWLEQRVRQLEGVLFPSQSPAGEGQRQIRSNPNRTESGMGPLLNSNSDFI